MADIRQDPSGLDNFDRADEDPIAAPWVYIDVAFPMAKIIDQEFAARTPNLDTGAYWSVETFDGDDCEVWGRAPGGSGPNTEGLRLGLLKDVGGAANLWDGYFLRMLDSLAGGKWEIDRYENGALSAALIIENVGTPLGVGQYALFRREGNDLVGYRSEGAGGVGTDVWVEKIRATDTTYTTGLYLALNIINKSTADVPTWDDFGGGPSPEFIPQIYRRVTG